MLFGAGSGLANTVPQAALPASLTPVEASWWFRLTPVYGQAFAVVGAFIVWRRPGNRIGWVVLSIGLLWAVYQFATGFAVYGTYGRHGDVPGTGFAVFLTGWEWLLPTVLMIFSLPFLFPDGRAPSPKWVPVDWAARVVTLVLVLCVGILPNVVQLPPAGYDAVNALLHFALVACGVTAVASVIARYRGAGIEVRKQLQWFALAYVVVALIAIAGFIATATVYRGESLSFAPAFEVLLPVAMIGVALSVAVAIFKYHLYDIDLFIRRTLVYGALVALIGLLYLVVVVSIGTRIGGNRQDPAIPFVLAAVVALAFQPVRTRLTRAANRLVYGRRATPYEVLSRFGEQASSLYADEDLPQRMARLLADGTEADRAEVWLRVGDELRASASWPALNGDHAALALAGGMIPAIPDAAEQAPVRFRDDLLGVLAVVKREPVTANEHRLLADLARHASVVLKNARLTAELQDRLDELQASRQRLVGAQDEERRRLERDLHDGAQQNLVALKIRLGMASTLASKDPERVAPMLEQLTRDADEAIQVLRRFSHGIYPPILAERGLVAALTAHARLVSVPTEVRSAADVPRCPRDAESAVYFCVLEALQNVVKHANAQHAWVDVSVGDGRLCFAVSDDGRGVDLERMRAGAGMQNMADRLAALGGELRVSRPAAGGTRLEGFVRAVAQYPSTTTLRSGSPAT